MEITSNTRIIDLTVGQLMEAFNVTTRAAFLQRLKGNVIPNVLEAHNVEKVFAKYGIKDVWGE